MPLSQQYTKINRALNFVPLCLCGNIFKQHQVMKMIFLLLSLILVTNISNAQEKDAKAIINNVLTKFNKVKTYEADAVIDVRFSFLKVLPQHAHFYFKQPDIFKVKSTGIALLPKQNLDNIYSLLAKKESYDAFITGTEKLGTYNTAIVNILPNTDTTDLVLAKVWVDEQENLVRKVQLTTRTNGTILIEYEHKTYAQYALPDKVTFTVDVKKFKIPKMIAADINSPVKKATNTKEEKKGRIIITIKNYKIN